MPTLKIKDRHLEIVRELLKRYAPDAEVWAYGSRVNAQAHDGSDLDIVLRNPKDLNKEQAGLAALTERINESNLPILVDARDWARLPKSFRRKIENNYIVIQ